MIILMIIMRVLVVINDEENDQKHINTKFLVKLYPLQNYFCWSEKKGHKILVGVNPGNAHLKHFFLSDSFPKTFENLDVTHP